MDKATDKQIAYLVRLAKKTEHLKRYDTTIRVPYIDWNEERYLGVTKADASIRIEAYRKMIRGVNLKRLLLGKRQIA